MCETVAHYETSAPPFTMQLFLSPTVQFIIEIAEETATDMKLNKRGSLIKQRPTMIFEGFLLLFKYVQSDKYIHFIQQLLHGGSGL